MRVSDYIFRTLADWGLRQAFLVTGGGAMHLNDALGREPRIQWLCNLHEQACAIAAEAYARTAGIPAVVCVTSGPGGTNAVTGVTGAWLDSIPMIVISGQIKTETMLSTYPELRLRQLGDQEINIVDIVRPITKYAAEVKDPQTIRYHLERACYLAMTGRPGPVWLDIPLDIQAAEISPDALSGYDAGEEPLPELNPADVIGTLSRLREAKRPVLIAGSGIISAGARELFRSIVRQWQIPVLTALSGIDLLPSDFPYFFGRPGILGARAANFILQNADLLLVIGTRMNIRQIGYDCKNVARAAYRIMVDIDSAELSKPTFRVDHKIHADAGDFLRALEGSGLPPKEDWLAYCRRLRKQYPPVLPEHRSRTDYVSSYVFPELLARFMKPESIIVTGNGTAYTSTFQALPVREGDRVIANVACAAMGYDLPAAIGAAVAAPDRDVLCITGDGSIQMNLQELQTIVSRKLPVKIFLYNNAGYLSIKLTQNSFFGGHFIGSTADTGIVLPDMRKIAAAYGFHTRLLRTNEEAERLLPEILAEPGPVLCEVMTDPMEQLGPKAASVRLPDGRIVSRPLEDLAPFLPDEELESNMWIPTVRSGKQP